MKIRTQFTLLFTIIVATILLLFSLMIYFSSAGYREFDFNSRLKERAITNVKLLVTVDEVDSVLLKIIEKNNVYKLPFEDITIYDENKKMLFSNDIIPISLDDETFSQIMREKEMYYSVGDTEKLGIEYHHKKEKFIVIASALDKFGRRKISNLRQILWIGGFVCILIILFSGWIYAGRFLKPISKVIQQVDKITLTKLNLRLDEGNKKDEIGQLAITFNRMLERLDTAFTLQKKFVSNASHELRTPLTSISGQIDVTLMNERDSEQYKKILISISEDIKNLRNLSNNLLELAHSDVEVLFQKFEEIRIDEILWNARELLIKRNPKYHIKIDFEKQPDQEHFLCVKGNEKLLLSAFVNIFDNACKFSADITADVKVSFSDTHIFIFTLDKGIGISEADMKNIFEPFYRGENAMGHSGHGIGLSLTQKIITLHSGEIIFNSVLNQGTTVKVSLPNFSNS
ncbi:MAG: hypothetical protein A2275_13410 [Bacteroidetes bacterium RIFOXYA12_FULL_35_11]|nr:MAG: hypothetical protein A2X01_20355 [Bacteroidetes bacterium GWF2_35_48]OFY81665.1 MAG: hypothetical protein A2275_13410 [Bacteroidetes bacterium RIFOXYA12_FULL_35_11]OFY97831.1 MAG: hypothetical protein A2491_08245 [Bacteroidetes bacterium RIFOXYC12_FULL_35_7]HBX50239.1 two-component sensor histidine kinase [Bacteroidales bacterium]